MRSNEELELAAALMTDYAARWLLGADWTQYCTMWRLDVY